MATITPVSPLQKDVSALAPNKSMSYYSQYF